MQIIREKEKLKMFKGSQKQKLRKLQYQIKQIRHKKIKLMIKLNK